MRDHHDVESRADAARPEPLSHESLGAIPSDGSSDFPRSHDAKPRGFVVSPPMHDHDGEAAASRRTLMLHAEERRALQKPFRFWKVRRRADYFFQVDTVSRLRPLRRRLARTFWPPLVLMRLR